MQTSSVSSRVAKADLAACRALLRNGSKSFFAASTLLPRDVRDAATALYAFCRQADDAVDLHHGGADTVARLRERLDRIYVGRPDATCVDRALCEVVSRFQLPRLLFDALIEGFEWDAEGRRYQTLEEVEQYAARVAGTIGAMMSLLMGARSPSAVARACDLGVAMQLTNIARDVGEDARAGRIYLPLRWMTYAGIDPERWLLSPQMSPGLRMVIDDLLHEADYLYASVDAGVAQLPRNCQSGINAARFIYADIGRIVRSADCDSVSRRAVVPKSRKIRLLLKSYAVTPRMRDSDELPAHKATQFLVESVAVPMHDQREPIPARGLPWWQLRSRALWLLDLLERTERRARERAQRPGARELSVP